MAVLLCVATGDYLHDWQDCIQSHRTYCAAHGYDYRLIDRPLSELHPKWQKFEVAREILRGGDDVLLIDADALISTAAPPFLQVLEADPCCDIFCVLGRSQRPNSGVIMLRGSAPSVACEFLTDCLAARELPLPAEDFVTALGENGHFIHFLKKPPYAGKLKLIDGAWNNTVPPPLPTDFVTHFAGGPMRKFRRRRLSAPAAG
ncbi:hypothetical protein [Falsiroseomonas sp.]|uniref:hypothetical protein n=1 Tax=Falsiroseomonas sp. TaxID=2870721 RepID=UPI003F6F822F